MKVAQIIFDSPKGLKNKPGFVLCAILVMLLLVDLSFAKDKKGEGHDDDEDRTAMTIYKTADLRFGDIITNGTGGSVTVSTDGAVSYQGVTGFHGGATPQPAEFQITGEAHCYYFVDIPKNIRVRNEQNRSMKVEDFTMDSQNHNVLDRNGEDVLRIGASLKINPNQDAGHYHGEFRVTANYN